MGKPQRRGSSRIAPLQGFVVYPSESCCNSTSNQNSTAPNALKVALCAAVSPLVPVMFMPS
jgi:hypothetical protein